jgi:hypothetical protein
MHGVEPGKQSPDQAGPLPCRQGAIELANGGRGGFENVEDVLDAGETRNDGPEASAATGVEFKDAGVQFG